MREREIKKFKHQHLNFLTFYASPSCRPPEARRHAKVAAALVGAIIRMGYQSSI